MRRDFMKNQHIKNSFISTLNELRSGRGVNELSERLAELVGAVKETGKAGTLTLQLKIAPAIAGDVSQLFVSDVIKLAVPQPMRSATLFYPSEENTLLRRDPNQRELELRSVEGGAKAAELKEVANG
jgi:hypothetical protein